MRSAEPIEVRRIRSVPVRRAVSRSARTVHIGPVEARAEMTCGGTGGGIHRAMFPLPDGRTGVVQRADDDGLEWLASAGGPWLAERFSGIHDAVEVVIRVASEEA